MIAESARSSSRWIYKKGSGQSMIRPFTRTLKWCALGILTFIFCGGAHAQDKLEVDEPIDNVEIFERIVLGRELRSDWASKELELLTNPQISFRIVVDESSRMAQSELQTRLEETADKLWRIARLVTHLDVKRTVTTEFTDNISAWCNQGSRIQLGDSPPINTVLILIGAEVDECMRSPQLRELFYSRTPTGDASDPDKLYKGYVTCSSRIRSIFPDPENSSTISSPRSKTMVVTASLEGNLDDLYRLQHCLFDRGFSFLGFRGRLIYSSKLANAKERSFESIRTAPVFEVIPSTFDLLMLALAYQFLGDGADYSSVKDDIRKKLVLP